MLGWIDDIEKATLDNENFRMVLFTGKHTQLTVMRLAPGEEIGWEAQVHFEEGLARTVDWYRENEAWWAPIRSGEYRRYYENHYGKALGAAQASS